MRKTMMLVCLLAVVLVNGWALAQDEGADTLKTEQAGETTQPADEAKTAPEAVDESVVSGEKTATEGAQKRPWQMTRQKATKRPRLMTPLGAVWQMMLSRATQRP